MRQAIHHHYAQLTVKERGFVDAFFDGKHLYELAQAMGIPLAGDDRVERAVDALARAVIESRSPNIGSTIILGPADAETVARLLAVTSGKVKP